MGKKILRIIFALFIAVLSYVIGVALCFLNYNWNLFTQFVKNFNYEVVITLIFPLLISCGLLHAFWPHKKKS